MIVMPCLPFSFRQKDASEEVIDEGNRKKAAIQSRLKAIYLQRKKEVVLADVLPEKHESIVFCELSDIQKRIYNHILDCPDFESLRLANSPCDCGVNQKVQHRKRSPPIRLLTIVYRFVQFFLEYEHLRSRKEKIDYFRRNKGKLIQRGKCCYQYPRDPNNPGKVDQGAVLWLQQHEGSIMCKTCPKCTSLPAMSILIKVSSHAALLQVDNTPDKFGEGSQQRSYAEDNLARAKQFIPHDCLAEMPGGYVRENTLVDDHCSMSGKMVALHQLLKRIDLVGGRVLLFSCYTTVLDLVSNYLDAQGYTYLRMDGQTPQKERDEIADKFRKNDTIFVFLLSTKAMGTGLNLKEANFVIIFDPDWNPANDKQAQGKRVQWVYWLNPSDLTCARRPRLSYRAG